MIYLSGSYSSEDRTMMQGIANYLRKWGYDIYCPFEFKLPNAWDYSQEDWADLVFANDISKIDECDILLYISPGRESTAGSNWEQGYAYAKGKKIIVLQYTDKPTSLITFSGSTIFKNSTNLKEDSLWALERLCSIEHAKYISVCKTTLT